ncbi:MAG: hypothetical protein IK013_09215, partial [Bacteroidales bacterium]|nr:hypothetical protein [Bacteroidales bacterium]
MKKFLLIAGCILMIAGALQAQESFTAEALYNTSYSREDSAAAGNHISYPCMSTGRVQLKIRGGSFPYTVITIKKNDDNSNDTLRTTVFTQRQYSDTDATKYNYFDHYTIDSLPSGNYIFTVTDGDGNTVTTRTVYLDYANVYPSWFYLAATSSNPHHHNVISVKAEIAMPYYCYDTLHRYAQYRISYGKNGGIHQGEWKHLPPTNALESYYYYDWDYKSYTRNAGSLVTIYIKDTVNEVGSYCELYDSLITFEYRVLNSCDTNDIRSWRFQIKGPSEDYFLQQKQRGIEVVSAPIDSCYRDVILRARTTQFMFWYKWDDFTNPSPTFLNVATQSHAFDYYLGYYTYPFTWIYQDWSANALSDPRIKTDHLVTGYDNETHMSISYPSVLTRQTLADYYGDHIYANQTLKYGIKRTLIDAKGCVLFVSRDTLVFDYDTMTLYDPIPYNHNLSQAGLCGTTTTPNWGIGYDTPLCDTSIRVFNILDTAEVFRDMTNTVIEVTCARDTTYNFTAVYNGTEYEITKNPLSTAEFTTVSPWHLSMKGHDLPEGRYIVKVTQPYYDMYDIFVDETFQPESFKRYENNIWVDFSTFNILISEQPSYTTTRKCQKMYVTYTNGQFSKENISKDHVVTSTENIGDAKFRVISGPSGGYSPEAKNINEPIFLTLPGDYVIEMFLDSIFYSNRPCRDERHYDTIHNDGGAIQKDYAWALMCNNGTGDVFVKGKNGTEPYTYTLSTADGVPLGIDTTGVFKNRPMNSSQYLSCEITDTCGSSLLIDSIKPEFISNVPQAEFENSEATLCERDSLYAIDNEVGNLYGYKWDGPNGFQATTSGPAVEIPVGAVNGWYKVTINTECPHVTTDSIYLTIKRVPQITLTGSDTICPDEDVVLGFTPLSFNNTTTDIHFTIAFSDANRTTTRDYSALSGATIYDTVKLYANTKIYPIYIDDEHCHNTVADPSDTVYVHLRNVASSDHIFTSNDITCYNSGAHLEAWSDYETPYIIRWHGDRGQTSLLKEETVTTAGAHSTFDTTGVTESTSLYISLDLGKEDYCPTIYNIPTNNLYISNGVTVLDEGQAWLYYDSGGPESDYNKKDTLIHTVISNDGRPLTITFGNVNLSNQSRLSVYRGAYAVQDSLMFDLIPGDHSTSQVVSSSGTFTFKFQSGQDVASGWEALIERQPATARITAWAENNTLVHQLVCQAGDNYNDIVNLIPAGIATPSELAELDSNLHHGGDYEYRKILGTDTHGCDSIFTLSYTVREIQIELSDVTVCRFPDGLPTTIDDTATAFVIGDEDAPLSYQWRVDGVAVGSSYSENGHKQGFTLPFSDYGEHNLTYMVYDSTHNCHDSTTAILQVSPMYLTESFDTLYSAAEAPYHWRGESYFEAGTYYDTAKTVCCHCDSIFKLNLTVLFEYNNKNICANKLPYEYDWNTDGTVDTTFETGTESGAYYIHGTSHLTGTDTVIPLMLTVLHESYYDTTIVVCADSFTMHGHTYTASGTETLVLENGNAAGCDSIITLHLQFERCAIRGHVIFSTINATCSGNGKIVYALTDDDGNILADSTAMANAHLSSVRLYYKAHENDPNMYRDWYKGGFDTLLIDPGFYFVGVEGIYYNEHVHYDTILTIGGSSSNFNAYPFMNNAKNYHAENYGTLPSLTCMSTGRVQLRITGGQFPYRVKIINNTTHDTLRTDVFNDRQHSGTDSLKSDYHDYYSIDSLHAGQWKFIVENGCGEGIPTGIVTVGAIRFPTITNIYICDYSGSFYDSNTVKIRVRINETYDYCYALVHQYAQYRFGIKDDGGDTLFSDWKQFPTFTDRNEIPLSPYVVEHAHAYCDIWDHDIILQYRVTGSCDTLQSKKFQIHKPNSSRSVWYKTYYTDTYTPANPAYDTVQCDIYRIDSSYYTYYRMRYDDYAYDNYCYENNNYQHYYTYPLTWVQQFWNANAPSDTITKRVTVGSINAYTNLYATEVADSLNIPYSPSDPIKIWLNATLVDGKGCVLYSIKDSLIFKYTRYPRYVEYIQGCGGGHVDPTCTPKWDNDLTYGKLDDNGYVSSSTTSDPCGSRKRAIRFYEDFCSEHRVVIRLTMSPTDPYDSDHSPYDNLYNFVGIYDPDSVPKWRVVRENPLNTAEIRFEKTSGFYMFTLADYNLLDGIYDFDVESADGANTYYYRYVTFEKSSTIQLVETPVHTLVSEGCVQNLKYTAGKFRQVTFTNTPHPEESYRNLTTNIHIIDGPIGYYNGTVGLNQLIPLYGSGRYIVEIYGTNYSGSVCANSRYRDTIYYDGYTIGYDHAYALLCEEGDTVGTVYVGGAYGTSPYTYTLYSDANLHGEVLGIDTTGIFYNIPMHSGQTLSCKIEDACGFYLGSAETTNNLNFPPSTLSDIQKVWFEDGTAITSTCEGTTVRAYAITAGDVFGYEWTGPNGFSDTTANPTITVPVGSESGWYKVTILNTNCAGIVSDSIYLNVEKAPSITLTGNDTICPGEKVVISFTPYSPRPETTSYDFTIAFSDTTGVTTRQYSVPYGATITDTFSFYLSTTVYPVSINDGHCEYIFNGDADSVYVHVLEIMATSEHIFTKNDTTCYNDGATLEAWSDWAAPYTIRWYNDMELTSLLKEETITSDYHSTYDTTNLTSDITVYVTLDKEGYCPTTYGLPTRVINMSNDTIVLVDAQTWQFFDSGGPTGNYGINEDFTQTFVSASGRPLTLKFNTLHLSSSAHLQVYKGMGISNDSLIRTITSSNYTSLISSKSGIITVKFRSGVVPASGWSATVEPAPATANVLVWPENNQTKVTDNVCQSLTGSYSDPYHIVPAIATQEQVDSVLRHGGTYTFTGIIGSDQHGCDSTITLTLNVRELQPSLTDWTLCLLPNSLTNSNNKHYETASISYVNLSGVSSSKTYHWAWAGDSVTRISGGGNNSSIGLRWDDYGTTNVTITATDNLGCSGTASAIWQIKPAYLLQENEIVNCATDTPFHWRGKALYETGLYYDSLQTSCCHCDSVYMLNLTVAPPLEIATVHELNICNGNSLELSASAAYCGNITHTYHDDFDRVGSVYTNISSALTTLTNIFETGAWVYSRDTAIEMSNLSTLTTRKLHLSNDFHIVFRIENKQSATLSFRISIDGVNKETISLPGRTKTNYTRYFDAATDTSIITLTTSGSSTYLHDIRIIDDSPCEFVWWQGTTDTISHVNTAVANFNLPEREGIKEVYVTATNGSGCKTTDTVLVNVYDCNEETICSNELPITRFDTTFEAGTVSGFYYIHTTSSVTGADTVIGYALTVLYETYYDTTITVCDESFTMHGHTYTEQGDYTIVLDHANAVGCDSIITLHLLFRPYPELITQYPSLTTSGEPFVLSASAQQCGDTTHYVHEDCSGLGDGLISEYYLPLRTIFNSRYLTWSIGDTAFRIGRASSYGYIVSKKQTAFPHGFTLELRAKGNYGSKLSIYVQPTGLPEIKNTIQFTETGEAEYQTFVFNYDIENTGFTLELSTYKNDTIGEYQVWVDDIRIIDNSPCEYVWWHNATDTFSYTSSASTTLTLPDGVSAGTGEVYVQATNAYGCSTVDTVTINLVDYYMDTICANKLPKTLHGIYFASGTVSGLYSETFTSSTGTDSVVKVNLVVLPRTVRRDTVTACGSYTWYGTTYTTSGVKSRTLYSSNVWGCDSIEYLHLTILPLPDFQLNHVAKVCSETPFDLSVNPAGIPQPCTFYFNLHDSYGDGWNNAAIKVYVDGATSPSETFTISSGSSASYQITSYYGEEYAFSWTKGGYPNECSFEITDSEGNTIFAKARTDNLAEGIFTTASCPTLAPPYEYVWWNSAGDTISHSSTVTTTLAMPQSLPVATTAPDTCIYTINLHGAYNDSWTNSYYGQNAIKVLIDDVPVDTLTIEQGSTEASYPIALNSDLVLSFVWEWGYSSYNNNYGNYCWFEIVNPQGDTIFIGEGSDFPQGGNQGRPFFYTSCSECTYTLNLSSTYSGSFGGGVKVTKDGVSKNYTVPYDYNASYPIPVNPGQVVSFSGLKCSQGDCFFEIVDLQGDIVRDGYANDYADQYSDSRAIYTASCPISNLCEYTLNLYSNNYNGWVNGLYGIRVTVDGVDGGTYTTKAYDASYKISVGHGQKLSFYTSNDNTALSQFSFDIVNPLGDVIYYSHYLPTTRLVYETTCPTDVDMVYMTVTNEYGCSITDSVMVSLMECTNKDTTICASDLPFTWNDTTFYAGTETGTYLFHHTTSSGEDSITSLRLTIIPPVSLDITPASQTIIYGQSITPITIAGEYGSLEHTTIPAYYSFDGHSITGTPPGPGSDTIVFTASSGTTPSCSVTKQVVVKVSKAMFTLTCPPSSARSKTYDGQPLQPHATVSNVVNGDTVKIEYSVDQELTWSDTAPSITHVSESMLEVRVRARHPKYEPIDCSYYLNIGCRSVVLTSLTRAKIYDGTPLMSDTVHVGGNRWIAGKEATYDNFASITNVSEGEYYYRYSSNYNAAYSAYVGYYDVNNTFDYHLAAGEDSSDYCITVNTGLLFLKPATIDFTCPPDTTTKIYDGIPIQPTATATGIPGDTIQIEYKVYKDTVRGYWSSGNYITYHQYLLKSTQNTAPSFTHTGFWRVDVKTLNNSNYSPQRTCSYYINITCREIALKSADSTIIYNGDTLKAPMVTVTSDSSWIVGKEATYSNFAYLTLPDSVRNTFDIILADGELASDYCITIDTGKLVMKKADLTLTCPHDTAKLFDGTALRPLATATGVASGDEIKIEYGAPNYYGNLVWGESAPGLTHVRDNRDSLAVQVRASHPAYDTAYCNYYIKINCRQITLTSYDSTKKFDGSTLRYASVAVSGDGWVPGHEGSYNYFASITYPGTTENSFGVSYPSGEYGWYYQDYCITRNYGTLTVTKGDIDLNCPDAAETTKEYNGNPLQPTASFPYGSPAYNYSAKIEYSTDSGATWSTTAPSITHVEEGPLPVLVRALDDFFDTTYCDYTLTMTCRPITLQSGTSSRAYNGTELRNENVTIGGSGWIRENGATGQVSVNPGQEIAFSWVDGSSDNECSFNIVDSQGNAVYTVNTYDNPSAGIFYSTTCPTGNTEPCTFTLNMRDKYDSWEGASIDVFVDGVQNSSFTVYYGDYVYRAATYSGFPGITNPGSIPNSFTYTLYEGEQASDYCITVDTGTLSVQQANFSLYCPSSASKTYDGNPLQRTASTSLWSGQGSSSDTILVEYSTDGGNTWSTTAPSITHVDESPLNVQVRASHPNYIANNSPCNYTLTINCRNLTVTSYSNWKYYDGTELRYEGASYSGWPYYGSYSQDDTAQISVGPGQEIAFSWVKGSYDNECSFNIVDPQGTIVHTVNTYDSHPSGIFYTATCPTGSTDSCTYTLYMHDLYSDGWNSAAIDVLIDGVHHDYYMIGKYPVFSNFAGLTNVDTIPNTFDYILPAGDKDTDYCVTVNYGTLSVRPSSSMWISAYDRYKMYDGTPLYPEVSVHNVLSSNDTIHLEYSVDNGATWTDTVPYLTHVLDDNNNGDGLYVRVRGTHPNYNTASTSFRLQVYRRNVSLESESDSKDFDGMPLTNHNVHIYSDGFVDGEGATFNVTGSQTDVGSSPNEFTYTLNSNTEASDYNIYTNFGTLRVYGYSISINCPDDDDTWKYYDGTKLMPIVTATGNSGAPVHIEYSVDNGTTWSDTVPYLIHVYDDHNHGDGLFVMVQASAPGHETTGCKYTLQVKRRPFTLTTVGGTRMYDGTDFTMDSIIIGGMGFAPGEEVMTHTIGSQRDVGKCPNMIDMDFSHIQLIGGRFPDFDHDYYFDMSTSLIIDTLYVTPRHVTLVSGDSIRQDDGTPLTYDTVFVHGDGFIAGEGFTANVTGEQIGVGSSPNTFTYTLNPGTKAINYEIDTVYGTLTLTRNMPITLRCPADTAVTKMYDGTPLRPMATATGVGGAVIDTIQYSVDGGLTWSDTIPYITHVLRSPGYDILGLPVEVRAIRMGYDTAYCGYTLTVTPRPITLATGSSTKIYDGDTLTNSSIIIGGAGFAPGEGITADLMGKVVHVGDPDSINYINPATISIFGGLRIIPINIAQGEFLLPDYSFDPDHDITWGHLTVTPRHITISTGSGEKMYDGYPLTNPTITVGGDGWAPGEGFTAAFTGYQLDEGWCYNYIDDESIEFYGGLTMASLMRDYVIDDVEWGELYVWKRTVVLTSGDSVKQYDGTPLTNHQVYVSGDGFANGDGFVGPEGFTAHFTGEQTEPGVSRNEFTYTLNSHTKACNYEITRVYGILTVTDGPAIDLHCPAMADRTKKYDGTPLQPVATATATGLASTDIKIEYSLDGDSWSETAPLLTHVNDDGNGGDGLDVYVRATYPGYDTVYCAYSMKITPRTLVFATGDSTKMYDGTPLTYDTIMVGGDGFVGAERLVLHLTSSQTNVGSCLNIIDFDNISMSDIQFLGGIQMNDYELDENILWGTLTVTPRSITLFTGDSSKTYDGTPLVYDTVFMTGDGFAAGEGATYNVTGSQTEIGYSPNAFTYSLNSGTNANNYLISTAQGTLRVTQGVPITLICPSANDATKMYDGSELQPVATATGVNAGDVIKIEYSDNNGISWSETAPSIINVMDGPKEVLVRASHSGYDTVYCDYTLTVTPRHIVLRTLDSTMMYNGDTLRCDKVEVLGDGFANGEGVIVHTGSWIKNVGTRTNYLDPNFIILPGTNIMNYSFNEDEFIWGILQVVPRILVIRTLDSTRMYNCDPLVYDSVEVIDNGSLGTGFAPGECAIMHTRYDLAPVNVGSQTNYLDGDNMSLCPGMTMQNFLNYTYDETRFEWGTLTVTPRRITLVSADSTKVYDGDPLTNDRIFALDSDFVCGQGFTANVTGSQTAVGSSPNTFTYTLNDGTEAFNYEIDTTYGTLTVTSTSCITTFGDTSAIACDKFTWYDSTYTVTPAVNPTHTFTNAAGCDSVVTLHLTIKGHTSYGTEALTVCDSLVWHGRTYLSSGSYNDTLANASGCDSIVTLNLTVKGHTSYGTEALAVCDSLVWHGRTYLSSGSYNDTLANASGCDSIVTLNLTVKGHTSYGTETLTVCDSLVWHGRTYLSSGTYYDTLANASGCDSVVTLNLTV